MRSRLPTAPPRTTITLISPPPRSEIGLQSGEPAAPGGRRVAKSPCRTAVWEAAICPSIMRVRGALESRKNGLATPWSVSRLNSRSPIRIKVGSAGSSVRRGSGIPRPGPSTSIVVRSGVASTFGAVSVAAKTARTEGRRLTAGQKAGGPSFEEIMPLSHGRGRSGGERGQASRAGDGRVTGLLSRVITPADCRTATKTAETAHGAAMTAITVGHAGREKRAAGIVPATPQETVTALAAISVSAATPEEVR